MSDTTVSERRRIRIGKLAIEERLLLRLVTWGILFALAVAVLLLRLQRLDDLPPGLWKDVDLDGLGALRILQGEHAVYFPNVGAGQEASMLYVLALTTLLFGRTRLAMHLPTALGSAGMVFAVFWIGRLLFGRDEESGEATPWRGLSIGGVAAGVMAVSLGQTILGRTGYNNLIHMALILTLCLGLLWWGWKERRRRWVVLAGVCAGILPYTYFAAYIAPVLFFAYGLSFLSPLRSVAWERVRGEFSWAATFVGIAGLLAAPLLIHIALHPEHHFQSERWSQPIYSLEAGQWEMLRALVTNVLDHLALLSVQGDLSPQRNFAGRPILNPWETALFLIGVGMSVIWWRRSTNRLLLLWLAVMVVPAFLSSGTFGADSKRMVGATPAIYLLLGVGAWEAFRFLKERVFRGHGTKVGIVAGSVAGIAIMMQGINVHRTYFTEWAASPEVNEFYNTKLTGMMKAQEAWMSMPGVVYLLPLIYGEHSLEYLYDRHPSHFLWAAEPDLPQIVESLLSKSDELSNVRVVEWGPVGDRGPDADWDTDKPNRFIFLLSKYGRYQGSEGYGEHRIHSFTDIHMERAWTFYEELDPRAVAYDGGIALQGVALGQGGEQMSTAQALELGRERPMWMALQWRIEAGLAIDYAFSLRLHDAAGGRVFQEDGVLWDAAHRPTSHWQADGPVDTLDLIQLPADLPAGEYELRLVVYDFETLVPTVEVGVWEPEVTLARLRLGEGQ